jgi:transcriptional antiterminator NusG
MSLQFYSVRTRPGRERQVVAHLTRSVTRLGLGDRVGRILAPTETVAGGASSRDRTRPLFTGYVLVEMASDAETLAVIRATPGVTGFLGGTAGQPAPLPPAEAARVLDLCAGPEGAASPATSAPAFAVGDRVVFTSSRFASLEGEVDRVDPARGTVAVRLWMFGQPMVTEVPAGQLRRRSPSAA